MLLFGRPRFAVDFGLKLSSGVVEPSWVGDSLKRHLRMVNGSIVTEEPHSGSFLHLEPIYHLD